MRAIILSMLFSWVFNAIKKKKQTSSFLNISAIALKFKLVFSFANETNAIVPTFLKALYKGI